ncbi:MAG: efflux RND transporter periplasmic adaptor subunit [Proteobacteria bacterium]|nr:efflux RND transporter periplasmic adaptor subunit [Pseudomonadota bacterium]
MQFPSSRHLVVPLVLSVVGPAFAQEAPVVLVSPVQKREVMRVSEFVGQINAIERVDVRVRVTGTLLKPQFTDGQRVEPGQLLYEIDPAPFQADVDSKKAQVESAKADALNADISFKRAEELLKTAAGTRANYDLTKANLAKADASVLMATAALENSNITLGYTKITAPIPGRIGRTAITEGNIVSPSSGVLTTIVRDDKVRALFSVSQREMLDYRKAAYTKAPEVRLRLADNSIYNKPGTIDFIDNVIDPKTDSQVIRAVFDNPDRTLVHDQTVRVLIEQAPEAPQLVVSQDSIAADQTGTFVMVVDGEQKVATRYVKLGQSRDGLAVVTDGLKEGENVIVQGMQRVRNGMKVNAQKAQAGK